MFHDLNLFILNYRFDIQNRKASIANNYKLICLLAISDLIVLILNPLTPGFQFCKVYLASIPFDPSRLQ